MIVADASALIQLLLRTDAAASGEVALFDPDRPAHAPHLLDVEVASVFRRLVTKGEITAPRGAIMLELLHVMPIVRHDHLALLPRIWVLRDTISAYDAAYVALAEALGAALLTHDGRLARAIGRLVEVVLV